MPSPPLLVHCLDHLADAVKRAGEDGAEALRAEADRLAATAGVVRPSRAPIPTLLLQDAARPAVMRRDGTQWVLTTPLGEARLPDSNGLGQLARLLTTPGAEVSALELAGRAHTPVSADLGPSLDAQAKRAYRQRLLQLQVEADDAEAANDVVRGEHAHVEIDALLRELRRALGLGGRDRPTGSDAERARINVVRSLRHGSRPSPTRRRCSVPTSRSRFALADTASTCRSQLPPCRGRWKLSESASSSGGSAGR